MAMISTRGRYALRILIDLAENQGEDRYLPLKEVAERQGISEKYLESIVKSLVQARILKGSRGKGGGYRLMKSPKECTLGSVLRLTEGDLAPVACLAQGAQPCGRAAECRTLDMWKKFNILINDYFDGITIADLMKSSPAADNYII